MRRSDWPGLFFFVVLNPRVLLANRVDLGCFLFHKFSNYTPPLPTHDLMIKEKYFETHPVELRVKLSVQQAVIIVREVLGFFRHSSTSMTTSG